MKTDRMNSKRKELERRRNTLMSEIHYYASKIEETKAILNNRSPDDDNDSSDSDDELTLNDTTTLTDLKINKRLLQTCLLATQELTSLTIIESEMTDLMEYPKVKKPPVADGTWHEVTAECRVAERVPFSINFLVHKARGLFGATTYRNLHVNPLNSTQMLELATSVLPTASNPSEAVVILKNYASGYRSRRTTLAHLAETFAENVLMEPMTGGGYLLKCADLIEIQWTLQNKWSPIALFNHRMKFDLEYMDEAYIKVIKQLYKQILDPTIDTSERTSLLSKIINTCLEAKPPQAEDSETTNSENCRTDTSIVRTMVEDECEVSEDKNTTDNAAMGPPTAFPKKTKYKGKENTTVNKHKTLKRSSNIEARENNKKVKSVHSKMSESQTSTKKVNVNQEDKRKVVSRDTNNRLNPGKHRDNDDNSESIAVPAKKDVNKPKDKLRSQSTVSNVDKINTKHKKAKVNSMNEKKKTAPIKGNIIKNKLANEPIDKVIKSTVSAKDRGSVTNRGQKIIENKDKGARNVDRLKVLDAKKTETKTKDRNIPSQASTSTKGVKDTRNKTTTNNFLNKREVNSRISQGVIRNKGATMSSKQIPVTKNNPFRSSPREATSSLRGAAQNGNKGFGGSLHKVTKIPLPKKQQVLKKPSAAAEDST